MKQGQRQAATAKSSLETKLTHSIEENERIKAEMRQIKQTGKVRLKWNFINIVSNSLKHNFSIFLMFAHYLTSLTSKYV